MPVRARLSQRARGSTRACYAESGPDERFYSTYVWTHFSCVGRCASLGHVRSTSLRSKRDEYAGAPTWPSTSLLVQSHRKVANQAKRRRMSMTCLRSGGRLAPQGTRRLRQTNAQAQPCLVLCTSSQGCDPWLLCLAPSAQVRRATECLRQQPCACADSVACEQDAITDPASQQVGPASTRRVIRARLTIRGCKVIDARCTMHDARWTMADV